MRNIYRHKIGSILGLFTILLTVVAPLISQGLRANAPVDFTLAALCTAHDAPYSVPAPSHDPAPHTAAAQPCAYCAFSLHFPVLPPAAASIAIAAPQPAPFSALVLALAFRPAHVATRAQPRAPPPSLLS